MEILALVAKEQLTVETGHSSPEEILMIIQEARRLGVQNIVVTHAMQAPVGMTIPQMQQAARAGAYVEFVYGSVLGRNPAFQIADFARAIRAVGPASCILASDLGQPGNPLHPDGLVAFFDGLRKEGFSPSEIELMSQTNPARILGLR